MKLVPVYYFGFTSMDRRFSRPMLPWIVSEIRRPDNYEQLSLGIEEGCLQAYNSDFEVQFSHRVLQITGFSQADMDPCTFLYLLKADNELLLYCYLFQAFKPADVSDLYQQMKEQNHQPPPARALSTASSLTSLCLDISPSSSTFFEVLYIGKIKVWNKKVPDTFIDDALEKFKAHELEKTTKRHITRIRSQDSIRRDSNDSTASETNSLDGINYASIPRSQSANTNISGRSPDFERKLLKINERLEKGAEIEEKDVNAEDSSSNDEQSVKSNPEVTKLPVDIDDHNRTMVLQADRTDLRLISPDRKVVLMHKHHRDVTTCVQGVDNSDHFGFICRESQNTATYIGYVFKCESASVTGDAVQAIRQAFANADAKPIRTTITSCDHCPMVWFNNLCAEIEHLTDRKTQAAILRRVDQLDEEEQNVIMTKYKGVETDSIRDKNEFLMMLLRAHCEQKQVRHVHDTAENRSEFLNQYLGGSTIFTKARRSLSNSFDHLLKRRASKDDFFNSIREMTLPVQQSFNKETSPFSTIPTTTNESSDKDSEGTRSRSSTIGSQNDVKDSRLTVSDITNKSSVSPDRNNGGLKSPMMDIFLKVGSSPKSVNSDDSSPKLDAGSWRQAIFKRVVTPSKPQNETLQHKRTREDLRGLWKKSINQAILLVRMEKENENLKAKQEENAVKRIKLEYDEMRPQEREVMDVWDMVSNKDTRMKCDQQLFLQAIRQGVPRSKRGEVWTFLAEQFCSKIAPIDAIKYPNYNVPYETWLKQLTSHQHAILIDLGRTFPSHSYFSSPLGPGQLALFNLLKAYSLLDPEVGYCQGLSFVAGVLLLHMEESQAFFLLRHLMFRRGLRRQYLPDMMGLQVKLYQLSRLVRDRLPELYEHFDFYEVAPTLYAAPWLLTIFASQFPLGFVTRVFDLIFLENTDVIFRVALALLSYHKDKLLACDGFEEIMNYLKSNVPAIDKPILDKLMKQVYTTDVRKQLNEYKVEYQVLQEEMASVQPQVEALHKIEARNKVLTEQNKALMAQLELALSNVQRLDKTRTLQQSTINKLEMQNRGYEVTIATLGSFINTLMDRKIDVEIPGEVRRIISQITISEKRKNEVKSQNNFMKIFKRGDEANAAINPNKLMVKSLSTGKITLPASLDQNMLRSNSLNTQQQSSQKVSQFFSSSHNNILQKQLSAQNILTNPKIDIKIQEFENDYSPQKTLPLTEESSETEPSPTHSIDSGVGTPSSPKEMHPLSNCDVNFTFNGTRELKSLKTLRNMTRNSSPDMIGK